MYINYTVQYIKGPRMSTLLLSLLRENPLPGLAVASLGLVVALPLVGPGLSLGIAISLLAWVQGGAAIEPVRARAGRMRVRHDRAGARAWDRA